MQKVQNVTVGILKKHRRVAFHLLHFRQKLDALPGQPLVRPREIRDCQGEMPQTRRLHPFGRVSRRRRLQ